MSKAIKAEFMPRDDTIEVLSPFESEEELTAAEKLTDAAIEQLSDNAEKGKTVQIYRQLGSGQESMEFVAKYPADKFTIDELINKLKVEYGGGDYRFMIRNEKGKLVANKLICIARKLSPSVSGDNQSGVYGVLERMMDKQDEFMRRMMANNQGGNSRMEMMNELVVMKELFSGNQQANPMSQMKEMFEMIAMVKEQANPEKEDDGGGFTKMITEAMPLLNTMAKAATGAQQPQPAHQPNPQRRTRQKPQEPQDMQKLAIGQLLTMAANGEEAADVAEKLSIQIPEAYIPQIESLILGNDALAKMVAINPKVADKKEWFLDVIEWLKGYLGHPCKYDAEFGPIDTVSQKDDNLVNSTNDSVIDGSINKPDDGNSERKSGNPSDT